MVSNDDIVNSIDPTVLLPIIYRVSVGEDQTHGNIVPVSKIWRLKGVIMQREHPGNMEVTYVDKTHREIVMKTVTAGTKLLYEPTIDVNLPSGWYVNCIFESGTLGNLYSHVLIEERDTV